MTQPAHTHAWAAGFFEGEGSVWVGTRHYPSGRIRHDVQCRITNTELVLLDKFKEIYGGNIRSRKGTKLSRKPLWEWYIFSRPADRFMREILPYSYGKKKHILENAIALRKRMDAKKLQNGRIAPLDTEEIAARNAIVTNIRKFVRG